MIRLSDVVRLPDGRIGTLAQFADEGLPFTFHKVTNFRNKGETKYFADVKGMVGVGWEIGELAFLSRTDKAQIQTKF
jgi:hypothetical protein